MDVENHIRKEQEILREAYYKLHRMCEFMKYPDKVKATALVYMQRFFLHNAIIEHQDIALIG
jgi:hypothetical protein